MWLVKCMSRRSVQLQTTAAHSDGCESETSVCKFSHVKGDAPFQVVTRCMTQTPYHVRVSHFEVESFLTSAHASSQRPCISPPCPRREDLPSPRAVELPE